MSNIINIKEYKNSENMPITEEDFNSLDNYKISTLFRVLQHDKKHRKQLLDNLFIRITREEDIEYFKNFLLNNDIFNYYVTSIIQSDNELYKIHLSLYYGEEFINDIYGNKRNLVKHIYKYGKNYELRNNTFDYLIKLSSLSCDYKTRAAIDKVVIKLFKKEIIELELCRLREMLYGNYFLMVDSKYIKEIQSNKMTKILKQVDKNYNKDDEDY